MDAAVAEAMRRRVEQMFAKCDVGAKGFIVKRDMQGMTGEVPLTPEQLEDVFDSLDVGNNGYLTVDQFLCGFGNFLSGSQPMSATSKRRGEPSATVYSDSDSFDDQFQSLIDQLREAGTTADLEALRRLCDDVNLYGSHEIQVTLEVFLREVVKDVTRMKTQAKAMEEKMRTRREQDEVQVRRLFDEMEAHLREEKLKMAAQNNETIQMCITYAMHNSRSKLARFNWQSSREASGSESALFVTVEFQSLSGDSRLDSEECL